MTDPQTKEEMVKYIVDALEGFDEANVKSVFITARMNATMIACNESFETLRRNMDTMRKAVREI